MTPPGLAVVRAPGVLEVRVEGRMSEDVVAALAGELGSAVDGGVPFTVLYDRRAVSAPTPGGRRALQTWPDRLLPALGGTCAAWGDVLDPRRAASLRRAGYPEDAQRSPYGYWTRRFTEVAEARRWLADCRAAPLRAQCAAR